MKEYLRQIAESIARTNELLEEIKEAIVALDDSTSKAIAAVESAVIKN